LPSLFTIGNILLGFYAVVLGFRAFDLGLERLFMHGALLVFVAGILDGLDGRIARLVGTESEFGKEYDSLADAITFGVAPALLAFFWGLHAFGRIGWLIPLFYTVCCVTRLARFNVQVRVVDARWFVGLPTPAAAAAICSILFFAPDKEWKPYMVGLLMVALIGVGLLMVSTFRYHSFKKIDLRQRWSYRAIVPIAAVVLVTAIHPRAFFLAVAVLYTLSGPVGWAWGRLRRSVGPRRGAEAEGVGEAETEGAAPAEPAPPEPEPPPAPGPAESPLDIPLHGPRSDPPAGGAP